MSLTLARSDLFDDPNLHGVELCRAYSDRMDEWLAALFERGGGRRRRAWRCSRWAATAAPSWPRSPTSTCCCCTPASRASAPSPSAIWYPIWDEGLKLGHAVRTPKEALALAADDLDTATSLVTVRHLAGDPSLTADLADRALALWRKRARRWLAEISMRVADPPGRGRARSPSCSSPT